MSDTVTIADYGSGNVLSVRRALEYNGATVLLTDKPKEIENAERLVLPGVGAFGDCMAALQSRTLVPSIHEFIQTGRPLLGICVGMQILMEVGYEFGLNDGLGCIEGEVVAIPSQSKEGTSHKIPHIGWSEVFPREQAVHDHWDGTVLQGVVPGTSFYFVHSMTARPRNPQHILAHCDYHGCEVTAAVCKDNITGLQFHPEKSAKAGLAVLRRFVEI